MRSLCNVSLALGLVTNLTLVLDDCRCFEFVCACVRVCLVCLRTFVCAYMYCVGPTCTNYIVPYTCCLLMAPRIPYTCSTSTTLPGCSSVYLLNRSFLF